MVKLGIKIFTYLIKELNRVNAGPVYEIPAVKMRPEKPGKPQRFPKKFGESSIKTYSVPRPANKEFDEFINWVTPQEAKEEESWDVYRAKMNAMEETVRGEIKDFEAYKVLLKECASKNEGIIIGPGYVVLTSELYSRLLRGYYSTVAYRGKLEYKVVTTPRSGKTIFGETREEYIDSQKERDAEAIKERDGLKKRHGNFTQI